MFSRLLPDGRSLLREMDSLCAQSCSPSSRAQRPQECAPVQKGLWRLQFINPVIPPIAEMSLRFREAVNPAETQWLSAAGVRLL